MEVGCQFQGGATLPQGRNPACGHQIRLGSIYVFYNVTKQHHDVCCINIFTCLSA